VAIDALLEACRAGAVEDAKTELCSGRFLAQGVRTTPSPAAVTHLGAEFPRLAAAWQVQVHP
jgi:hypothetical protein